MPNNRTITSANAIIYMSVAGLFPTPQRIQGFTADDVTDTDALATKELNMGVDGRLSAGYTPAPVVQNITLQADSQSNDFFETINAFEQQNREAFILSGQLTLLSTQRKYTMTRGFLSTVSVLPGVKKTLQPRRYTVTWQSVTPAVT